MLVPSPDILLIDFNEHVPVSVIPAQAGIYFNFLKGNKMKQILTAVLIMFVSTALFAGETEVSGITYSFTIPENVIFESHDEMDIYTFRWGNAPHFAFFMLNVNPAQVSERALKPRAEMMEITFEDQMKKQGIVSDIQKKLTDIELGPFEGIELEFIITQPAGIAVRQYMFILHDGDQSWNGQLTASSENDIIRAHAIMEKAKNITKSTVDNDKE